MPRISPTMTQGMINKATSGDAGNRQTLRDGKCPGLQLRVGARSASWRFEYKLVGMANSRALTIGTLDAYSLTQARSAADAARALVGQGIDPQQAKAAAIVANVDAGATQTINEALDRFIEERRSEWTVDTLAGYTSTLAYVRDKIGGMAMATVERVHLVRMIKGYLRDKQASGYSGVAGATRIADLMATLWRQAGEGTSSRDEGWEWPVDPNIARALPVRGKSLVTTRKRVLTLGEIKTVWAGLDSDVTGVSAKVMRALRLSLLTGHRIGAVANTKAEHLDLDPEAIVGMAYAGPTWRIPAVPGTKFSAKERREGAFHLVPIGSLAVSEFRAALDHQKGGVLFPGHKAKPISSNTISHAWGVLREHGIVPSDTTAHDLRRTMRSQLAELDHGAADEDLERLIGHKVGNAIQNTYAVGKRTARLRPIIDVWDRHMQNITSTPDAPVVPLRVES